MAVTPVIPTFSKRYKWPQSDAEFLRSVITDNKNSKETKNRINSTTSDESLSLSTSNYSCSSSVSSIDGSSTVGAAAEGNSNYQSLITHRQRYLRSYKFTKEEYTADEAQNWLDRRRKSMRSKLRDKKKKSSSYDRVFYALFKGLVCCMVIKVDDLYGEKPAAVSSTPASRHPR